MKSRYAAMALAALACACAATGETECRGADWYEIGFRDALLALRPQDTVYAHSCAKHGITVDSARYAQGWREGKYEADYRNPEPIQ